MRYKFDQTTFEDSPASKRKVESLNSVRVSAPKIFYDKLAHNSILSYSID